VTIHYGTEAVGLRQDAARVEVDARSADGAVTTHRAEYVVRCDGDRSTVRTLAGVPWDASNSSRR
jgi:2-polyprenyl-6-methoxyphenol hydroxylase-like FAD-dependent oxidoreductase